MSNFLDRWRYFSTTRPRFSDGHGAVTGKDRKWEDGYRMRWQYGKIDGVNCTGSCSWKV